MSSTNHRSGIRPPPFSNRQIVERAEAIGRQLIEHLQLPPAIAAVSFDAAYDEIIYPTYGIALVEDEDLGYGDDGEKIYGRFDPLNNVAYIDASLKNDPRRTFTCWHEVGGHGILQAEWLRRENKRVRRNWWLRTTESSLSWETTNELERQANLFASHAGAPTALLYYAIDDLLNPNRPIRYIGPGKYTLVFHGCWQWFNVTSLNDLCRIIAKQIQWRFGYLSVEALSYRIQRTSIIVDETNSGISLYRKARPAPTFALPTAHSFAVSY